MNHKKQILSLDDIYLFQSEEIKLRNSMDRYGFSYLIANNLGIKKPKRSFCNWVHGWVWWRDIMEPIDIVGTSPLQSDIPIVVATNHEKKLFLNQGIENDIFVGGLPIAYCPTPKVQKQPNSLLAVVAHSAEVESHEVLDENYFDFLFSIKDDWESIYILVYHLDVNEKLIHAIEKRGFKFIVGANPHDKYSLIRTKLIFSLADAVNSNVMGSHIAYALASNCKVSLVDNLYCYDPSVTIKSNKNLPINYVERLSYASSYKYLKESFNYLFVDPLNAKRNINLGNKYIGHDHILDNNTLKDVIGWNFSQQVSGFVKGFFRRSKRIIFTK